MKIGIFGSSGFIGTYLANFLSKSYQVKSFTRIDLAKETSLLVEEIKDFDVIINLVGAPIIAKRWTNKYKNLILNSRLEALDKIKEILSLRHTLPSCIISASAIGLYKQSAYSDEYHHSCDNGFLALVVKKWEERAFSLAEFGPRVNILRFGIVLGKDGGALKETLKIYKSKFAVIFGSKAGFYPFISIVDLCRAVQYLIENKAPSDIYNLVAPVKVSNLEFSAALSKILKCWTFIQLPGWTFRLILGQRANVIVAGQYVYPRKLLNIGFEFKDTDIADYLHRELLEN